jgi:hypothetical protein
VATWADVKGFVQEHYVSGTLPDGNLKMVFRFDDGRSQAVVVSRYTLQDGQEEWVEISSAIGELDKVNLKAALREMGTKVCGALTATGTCW